MTWERALRASKLGAEQHNKGRLDMFTPPPKLLQGGLFGWLTREGIRDERGREVPIAADEWCFGYKTKRANDVFNNREFMGEVHAHVFANRFGKEIIITDKRTADCVPMHYQPGYVAAKQISTRTAISLRAQKPDVLWLLLIRDHFEALQPI